MSQEPIPDSTDSESQGLPVEGASFSGARERADSAASANEDLSFVEEVWELVEVENETNPIAITEVSVEKVTELVAKSSSSKPSSRVASGTRAAVSQTTSWQRFWRYWQAEIQPALKEQTIKTLKATIRSLEAVVSRLEAPSTASLPRQSTAPWRQIRGIWRSVLGFTRSLLPRSLNRKLSDPLLSGAIASVVLLILWTTTSWSFSPSPTQVATAPPSQSAPAQPTDDKEKSVSNQQPAVNPTPDATREPNPAKIATEPPPKPTVLTPPEKTPDAAREPISRKTPDAAPAPRPTLTPALKPTPPLKLTPEQTLIARIQDQVAEVSNQYVNGLIQSVQANFRSSLLTVKVGDDWYTLEQAQQNKLANEMLDRAQQLNFVKLEMTDPESSLLARSPVVGSEMVILKRTTAVQQIT
jgi:hypothetical protein